MILQVVGRSASAEKVKCQVRTMRRDVSVCVCFFLFLFLFVCCIIPDYIIHMHMTR